MRVMQKIFFRCLVVFVTFLISSQVQAKYNCGGTKKYSPKLTDVGCEQLKVTITNKTNYTFSPESEQFRAGGYASLSSFPDIPALGTIDLYLQGETVTNVGKDEIDVSVTYVAHSNGSKVGTNFTLSLRKASCNALGTSYGKNTDHCYNESEVKPHCLYDATKCTTCHYCDDPFCDITVECSDEGSCQEKSSCSSGGGCIAHNHICEYCYDYADVYDDQGHKCDSDTQFVDATVSSLVSASPGLYYTNLTNTNAKFRCEKATVYQRDSGNNRYGETTMTINPSPIETLTITFPFNAQSPIAKLMRTTIYNNLNPKNLGGLSTYYSVTPVTVTDTTLTFSTLCNSASCPQP